MVSIMAIFTVFVLSSGEIDLSIASIPPMAGYIVALILRVQYPIIIAVLAALGFGALIGLTNGMISVKFRIPSFIVTLGMISVLEGLARFITGQLAVPVINKKFTYIFGSGSVGPIPVLVIWTAIIGIIGFVLFHLCPFGKAVQATGGNVNAALFSGIKTNKIKILVLTVSGISGGLAGIIYTGYLHNARFDLGTGALLTVLAAVVIGGTSLSGGKGSIIGAVAGAILLGLINNGLVLLGLDTSQQLMFRGALIIFAVALSSRSKE